MKLFFIILVGVLISPATPALSKTAQKSLQEIAPSWHKWNFTPARVQISKTFLNSDIKYLYGVKCTAGELCAGKIGSLNIADNKVVSILRIDNNIVIIDAQGKTLESWPITRDLGFSYEIDTVTPRSVQIVPTLPELALTHSWTHDQRSTSEFLLLHESRIADLPYQLKRSDLSELRGIYTIYLLKLPRSPMPAIPPSAHFGFFSVGNSLNERAFIAKWRSQTYVNWIVDRDVPDELYDLIKQGIQSWNRALKGLKLTVRRAYPNEELDLPLKNVIAYTKGSSHSMASGHTSLAANGNTGEILFSNIQLTLPPNGFPDGVIPSDGYISFPALFTPVSIDEYKRWVTYSVTHEVGHSLGLRHNFLGSAMSCQPEKFPAGYSVMDYLPPGSAATVGPYDQAAVQWAYGEKNEDTGMQFCTDEDLDTKPSCKAWDKPASSLGNSLCR